MNFFNWIRGLIGRKETPAVREMTPAQQAVLKKMNEAKKVRRLIRRFVSNGQRDLQAHPWTRCELYGRHKGR